MAMTLKSKQVIWRVAAAAALIVSAAGSSAQLVNDGCGDAGGGGGDIERLTASYEPGLNELVVNVTTCGPVNPSTKYRLRIDHFVGQQEYPAGSGTFVDATLFDGNPHCLGVADIQMMWNGKPVGPGSISVSGNTLTYRIRPAEFWPPVPSGRTIRLWAEAQTKGSVDRVPNTNAADDCAAPQFLDEATTVSIVYDPFGVVGTQAFDILRDPARKNESAMGNLVADSLRLSVPGVDAALINSGSLRADVLCASSASGEQPCEITWAELFAVLPFGNFTVVETVTGAQLTAALVNGLSPACNSLISTGRFPQISGLEVSYACVDKSVAINTLKLRRQGMAGPAIPIGPGDTVRLVTTDFMVAGGDGYLALTGGTDIDRLESSLLEILGSYVNANSPVAPAVEGRILQLAP